METYLRLFEVQSRQWRVEDEAHEGIQRADPSQELGNSLVGPSFSKVDACERHYIFWTTATKKLIANNKSCLARSDDRFKVVVNNYHMVLCELNIHFDKIRSLKEAKFE